MIIINKISNPLTIIGIFAGIAEVAGTIVLPFVSSDLQHIFIWYVIGFPVLIVIIFFLTLNYNHKVLYAPTDFVDENNFMQLIGGAVKASKKVEIIKENNPELATNLEDIQRLLNPQGYNKYYDILQILSYEDRGITPSELAKRMNLSNAYMHSIIQKLESNGVITSIDGIEQIGEKSRKVKRYIITK